MVTQLDYDTRQGTMLRMIASDIKGKYLAVKKKLYDPKYKGEGDYMKSAEDWNNIISDLFGDEEMYLTMVEVAVSKKRDLWKDEKWKSLMRIILPQQFKKRMSSYTQVPKLASQDDVRTKLDEKPTKWWIG